MPTSAELIDLTRLPNGLQSPPPPPGTPLSGNGAGTVGTPTPSPVAVGAAPTPQAAPPYPGQYAPQPYAASATPAGGGQPWIAPGTFGALGVPAESTTPLQRPMVTNSCVNGHSMPPNEVYCGICGAPRNVNGTGR
jgi:hypothetical protein